MLEKRLKKGDTVKVIAGKEKGKTGKILSTIPDRERVVIEKVNLIKRHKKADAKGGGAGPSDRPLIDTGQMVQSIAWELGDKNHD